MPSFNFLPRFCVFLRHFFVTLPPNFYNEGMNFEELLDSRNGAAMRKEQMPFGQLYKKMRDKKYENVLDLRFELADNLQFCEAIRQEGQRNHELLYNRQVHFNTLDDSAGLYGVSIEKGSFWTMEHLMTDQPAVAARKGYINQVINDLLDFTDYLHQRDIYHVCFAPSNVLVTRGDYDVMLLFHGSSYQNVKNPQLLWQGCEDYVAPEVMECQDADAASDIYSLGCFIKYMYKGSMMPPLLRIVVRKATQQDPRKRYQSVSEMRRALKGWGMASKTLMAAIVLAAVLFVGWLFYSTAVPQKVNVEYVNPVPSTTADDDDPLKSSIDPKMEDALMGAALDTVTTEEMQQREATMKEQNAKAEDIFRRQFTKDAERVLARVYAPDRMSRSESDFLSSNQSAMQELVRAQTEIAKRVGLNTATANRIAGEIIEYISNKKKAELAIRRMTVTPPETKKTEDQSTSGSRNVSGTSSTVPSFSNQPSESDLKKERIRRERKIEEHQRLLNR